MKNNKILCIGDSTSLPGHMNAYEDTWFFKLKQALPNNDFNSIFRRSISTNILVTEGGGTEGIDKLPLGADCLEFYNPSIVIIQLGIVDCSPRLLNNFDKLVLKILAESSKKKYINIIKKIRKRKVTNTVVSQNQFVENLKKYIERCSFIELSLLILISIPYPSEAMVRKNKEVGINVEKYNELISDFSKKHSFVKVITPLDCRKYKEEIYEDGYHPNTLGNQLVYQEIIEAIIKYNV